MKNLFSTLLTIAGLVVVFFGVYAITGGVTEFLQTAFALNYQQAVAGSQAFELIGRLTVTAAVVWRLAAAIRAFPSVTWEVIFSLLKERGMILALLIGAIMAASMQHRFYWLVNKLTNPDDAYQHTTLQAASNANSIALFSFAMLFVLFFEKNQSLTKPLLLTTGGLALGVAMYWTFALLI